MPESPTPTMTEAEAEAISEAMTAIVHEGGIVASIWLMTSVVPGLIEDLGEDEAEAIEQAIDNIASWYSDEFGDPFKTALDEAKFRIIADRNS